MPSRKYYLVGDNQVESMKQTIKREQIRNVSITTSSDYKQTLNSDYVCEVRKSPRAPEYEVHYIKTRRGIKTVPTKARPKTAKLPRAEVGGKGKKNQETTSEDDSHVESDTAEREKDDMVGLRVIACHSKDGLYYPGHVGRTPDSTYAMVNFGFKQRQKVRTEMIIPMSGAIPRPELQMGDYVLVKVFNAVKNIECYVPAIIEFMPEDFRNSAKFYSILLYNGQRATTMRKFIVKIGRSRFDMALRYISHIQQNTQKPDSALSDLTPRSRDSDGQNDRSDRSYDDASSDRSSQRSSNRGRRKKEKITSKLANKSKEKQKEKPEKRKKSRSSSSSSRSSKSRSRSRSSSESSYVDQQCAPSDDSSTPRARVSPVERPTNPVPKERPLDPLPRNDSMVGTFVTRQDIYCESRNGYSSSHVSRAANVDEKDQVYGELIHQLAKQTQKQLRQERRLIRQARKINKIQRKMRSSDHQQNDSLRSDKSKSQRSSSDTDTTQQRRKGSPDGSSNQESPDLLSMRRSLPGLRVEQEVLARWSDDGWYYRGCVAGEREKHKYIVQDATGHRESIWRDDIMADDEHKFDTIQPQDHIIGLHPKYVFSFAPAEVLDTYANNTIKVEFYDGNIAKLTSDDVYKISKAKYKKDVEYIKEREKHLVGKSVVARDNETGAYRLGVVDDFVGLGQQYFLKWLDGMVCKQTSQHMFEIIERQSKHEAWEYALAPVDQRNTHFMPAQVVRTDPLQVQFCDGNRSSSVHLDQCFWLNKDYYRNAVEYIYSRNEGLHAYKAE